MGGGRGARGAGGRVEPEGGVGSGRGAVEYVGGAARQGAIVVHLLWAVVPFGLDGWDACGGDGWARVCDDGRGHVRDGVGHVVWEWRDMLGKLCRKCWQACNMN